MTRGGVFAGAATPEKLPMSTLATPDSCMPGTFGNNGVPGGHNGHRPQRPASKWPLTAAIASRPIWISPAIAAGAVCAVPLYGT